MLALLRPVSDDNTQADAAAAARAAIAQARPTALVKAEQRLSEIRERREAISEAHRAACIAAHQAGAGRPSDEIKSLDQQLAGVDAEIRVASDQLDKARSAFGPAFAHAVEPHRIAVARMRLDAIELLDQAAALERAIEWEAAKNGQPVEIVHVADLRHVAARARQVIGERA